MTAAQRQAADPNVAAEAQLAAFTQALGGVLGGSLAALYLHGSLAHGGFEPARSDIDLLAVIHHAPTPAQRVALAQLLLSASCNPCPIEISIITALDASLLRHPVPFEFHYSEAHRDAYASGRTTLNQRNEAGDPDLVLHVLVARRRGRVLAGAPSAAWLPNPARVHVADSILRDLDWAQSLLSAEQAPSPSQQGAQATSIEQAARYLTTNALRAVAWARDDVVLSKQEVQQRAHNYFPAPLTGRLQRALGGGETISTTELKAMLDLVDLELAAVRAHAT